MNEVTLEMFNELKLKVDNLENRMNEKDTQFAVINTKLSAILWGVGILATSIIGVLVKLIIKI